MPRFQSRLFNWIDRSLPAQLGRRARRSLDQKFTQLAGLSIQELPRLLAYQAAKAALYPVYLIASTAKCTFPALDHYKADLTDQVRSQPDSGGLLPEFDKIKENLENAIEQNIELPKPEIPPLLRPLANFLNWLERTKIRLDRNIAVIVKRPSDNLANSDSFDSEPRLIANRIFAEIWQQQVQERQAIPNSLKENSGLDENLALGRNTRLEQLRRLIEAAIAYFFGDQPLGSKDNLVDDDELTEISGTESSDTKTLKEDPQLRRRKVSSAEMSDRLISDNKKSPQKTNLQKSISQTPAGTKSSGVIKENSPLSQNTKLDRLRELIAAAIDYFIGRRSLNGEEVNVNDIQGINPDLLSEKLTDNIQTSGENSPNQARNPRGENSNLPKVDDQLERLQKLIEEAIAYFFGKQRSQPMLDETSDITPSESAWLTMEDVFVDDNGPWPLPLEYESQAFTKSHESNALNSSGELQHFETTTTQISDDRLEGSLVFEEELLMYRQQSESESDRPLRAWIEARATILGYAYNPLMTVILWIDVIIAKIEDLIISFFTGLVNFPKRLIYFIRYGNRNKNK